MHQADSLTTTVIYSGDLPDQARRTCQALDEFLSALQGGRAPNVEEWLTRHADIAEVLRDQLDGLLALQAAAGTIPLRPGERDDGHSAGPTQSGRIGAFQLTREIGRGGMGIVYEAHDTVLGRRVALKLLPFAAVLNHKQLARFQNEAQAASRLHHPSIVPVYSIGCDRGMNYYAMQYVDGQSLEDVIGEMRSQCKTRASDRPPSTPGTKTKSMLAGWQSLEFFHSAAELGRNVALALQHAHDLGILHRDIKPSNLLLDQEGKVWVTDFGLARLPGDQGMTRTGEVLGSARYMSPEQASGQRSFVDHRSDIYSLGVTLYELVTLSPAFPTESREEFLQQVRTVDPLAPRKRNPAVPAPLEAIIGKAMEKSVDRRYATAHELADDLQRWLRSEPTRAERHPWRTRLRRIGRRHQTALRVAALVACLACLGTALAGGVVLRFAHRTRVALDESQRQFQRAESNYRAARQTVKQFGARMAQRLGTVPGVVGLRRELLQHTMHYYQSFIQQADQDPSLLGDVGDAYLQLGWLHEQLGHPRDAVAAYDAACRSFGHLCDEQPLEEDWQIGLARARNNRGLTRAALAELDAGRDDVSLAIAALKRLAERNPASVAIRLDLATALGNQALILADLDRAPAARTSLDQSVSYLRDLHSQAPEDLALSTRLAIALHNLSSMSQHGDRPRAMELAREALELQSVIVHKDPEAIGAQSDLVLCYQHLGTLTLQERQIAAATDLLQQAVEQCQLLVHRTPLVPAYQLDLATCRNNLARAYLLAGKNALAVDQFHQAEQLIESLIERHGRRPEYLSGLAGVHFNLGLTHFRGDDSQQATASMQHARELQREACELRPEDPRLRNQLDKMNQQALRYQRVTTGTDAATLAGTAAEGESLP